MKPNTITVTDMRAIPGDSAFLADNGETAVLCDTGFGFTGDRVAENIEKALNGRELNAVLLTHSHYDHVLGTRYILKRFPKAKVITSEYSAFVFGRPSAIRKMWELDGDFALRNGVNEYTQLTDSVPVDQTVTDGEEFAVGDINFRAIALPGHTKCSFGFLLPEEGILLGSETLGVRGEGDDVLPACLIGYKAAADSIEKVKRLCSDRISVPHCGLLDHNETVRYLENSEKCLDETVTAVGKMLKSGSDTSDCVEWFTKRFYKGSVVPAYPKAAMQLNTEIMVKAIKSELCK